MKMALWWQIRGFFPSEFLDDARKEMTQARPSMALSC